MRWRRAILILLLAPWMQACPGAPCDAGYELDPGGGGCIVIGGGADREDDLPVGGETEDLGDPGNLVRVSVVLDDPEMWYSLAALTDVASPISTVSEVVVGLKFVVLEISQDCHSQQPITTVVSPGPISVFPDDTGSDDALLALSLPRGEEICRAGFYWAGVDTHVPSFYLKGRLKTGESITIKSRLSGPGQVADNVVPIRDNLVLRLQLTPPRWLAVLDEAELWLEPDNSILVTQDSDNDLVLQEIESQMQAFSYLEGVVP